MIHNQEVENQRDEIKLCRECRALLFGTKWTRYVRTSTLFNCTTIVAQNVGYISQETVMVSMLKLSHQI